MRQSGYGNQQQTKDLLLACFASVLIFLLIQSEEVIKLIVCKKYLLISQAFLLVASGQAFELDCETSAHYSESNVSSQTTDTFKLDICTKCITSCSH